jgi:4-amino-4-deoxychorismate lyase
LSAFGTLIDGHPGDAVSTRDRGFCYGDGLFETIRFVGQRAPLWTRHMQRLQEGCRHLQLPTPAADLLAREARIVIGASAQAVVRISVTRGVTARGYALPALAQSSRVVSAFAMPPLDRANYQAGIRVRWCDLRLAEQPRLAGIKHLNRLEQVLARAEWSDPAIAEGLLCDASGRLVSATMANVFLVIDGRLATPPLHRCGVAGVARAEVLAALPAAEVRDISMADGLRASEVFLSSSVRGILPVQALGDKVFAPGPVTRAMQQHWRDLGFSMEQA